MNQQQQQQLASSSTLSGEEQRQQTQEDPSLDSTVESGVDGPTPSRSKPVLLAVLGFIFLGVVSGLLYVFVLDKMGTLKGMLNKTVTGGQAASLKATVPPQNLPAAIKTTLTSRTSTTLSSKAPMIVICVFVVLVVIGACVGGYFLYQKMAADQPASMTRIAHLNEVLKKQGDDISKMEQDLAESQQGKGETGPPLYKIIFAVLTEVVFTSLFTFLSITITKRFIKNGGSLRVKGSIIGKFQDMFKDGQTRFVLGASFVLFLSVCILFTAVGWMPAGIVISSWFLLVACPLVWFAVLALLARCSPDVKPSNYTITKL
jgi:flagellar basal body-associated protein FliL